MAVTSVVLTDEDLRRAVRSLTNMAFSNTGLGTSETYYHNFQLGDEVEALENNCYVYTRDGWRGYVTQVTNTAIWVRAEGQKDDPYGVDPKYFRLVKRDHGLMYNQSSLINQERKSMQKLTVMQKLQLSADDQTLTKAYFINDGGRLTEDGREALMAILFQANKAELVKQAQAILDEETSKK